MMRHAWRSAATWRCGFARCAAWSLLAVASLASAAAPILRLESGAHAASIRHLASDGRGEILLTASEDKTARLWRSSDGQPLVVLRPPIGYDNEGKLFAAALTADGQVAAVGGWSADNDVYLFRRSDGAMLSRISGLPNVVNHLAFAPDGRSLVVALWGGKGLRLYASSDGWRTAKLAGEDAAYGGDAYGAAFSPDGTRLVSSAYDGLLRLYDLRSGGLWLNAKAAVNGGKAPHGVQFAPDGSAIAVGFADLPRVTVVRADTLAAMFMPDTRDLNEGGLSSVAWSRDGRTLHAAGSWRQAASRNAVRRWDAGGRGAARDFVVAGDTVTDLLALADGRLAYAAADATWGAMAADGSVKPRVAPPRADYRAGWESFRVAADGRAVSFGFEFGGQAPATFDLAALAWRQFDAPVPAPPPSRSGIVVSDWKDSTQPSINGTRPAFAAGEVSLAMALHASERTVAFGTNWHVRLHDASGRELWRSSGPSACFAVAQTADGRFVVAAFGDGTIRWFRRADGEEVLAFFPHSDRKAWAVWAPDGRFATSAGGENLVGWHVNRGDDQAAEFLPVGRFSERHYDPAGIAAALTSVPRRVASDVRQGIRLPPEVQIVSPERGRTAQGERLRVEVRAQDRGGGVEEIRLFHNGKVVAAPAAARGKGKGGIERGPRGEASIVFEVPLESGSNVLRVLAFGKDRVESAADEVVVEYAGAPTKPRLHVLVVGINAYRNSVMNLHYSVPDARGVAGFFRDTPGRLFRDVVVSELYDAEATRAGLTAKLKMLQQSRPEDAVVVYFAGHGETVGEDWYFIPHELTTPERPEVLKRDGVSSREIAEAVKAMPARKVVVVIDACKSGAATVNFRSLDERRALAQLSRSTGTHMIAATTKDQQAAELTTLGHGVFTYTLLEGLKGKAAASGKDVTARKLMVYVEQALPELTKRYRAEEQYPVVSSTGMDFPLVVR